jgi:hypothetical protein
MSWWSILASLAGAVVLALLASACQVGTPDGPARDRAAKLLGVSPSGLRVTERSELSTRAHEVLRVSAADGQFITVVVNRDGGKVFVDSRAADGFARLASAEHLATAFPALGGVRVAGWFGALGHSACGELVAEEQGHVTVLDQGDAHVISYRFADAGHLRDCRLELGADGQVLRATAAPAPVAHR